MRWQQRCLSCICPSCLLKRTTGLWSTHIVYELHICKKKNWVLNKVTPDSSQLSKAVLRQLIKGEGYCVCKGCKWFICKALCLSAANSGEQETSHLSCSRLDYRGKQPLYSLFFFPFAFAIFHFQKTSLVRDLHVNLDGVCFCSSHEVELIEDRH